MHQSDASNAELRLMQAPHSSAYERSYVYTSGSGIHQRVPLSTVTRCRREPLLLCGELRVH